MFLKILFGICLLRANPQDVPTSNRLMLAALAAYAAADVAGVLEEWYRDVPVTEPRTQMLAPSAALLAAAVDTGLLAAATHLALRLRGFENRFTQTLTALAGAGAMLSLIATGAAYLAPGLIAPEWVWALVLVWYTFVFGHVLRQALSIPFAAGVAASLLYLIFSLSVTGLFVSPAPVEQ